MLYNFSRAHSYLDGQEIPRLEEYDNNVIIGRKEFQREEEAGELEFRNDGVYIKIDGEYKRGFLYNKDFLVDIHGMPKFHMTDCRTIQKFRRRGTLNKTYYWSNAPKVLVTQRNSSEEYPDTVLILCRNCSNEIVDEVYNQTDEEFAHQQFAGITPSSETDVFGRPLNWRTISRAYRRKVNFICEQCGFGGADLKNPAHRMFLDTHHINGYDLTDTSEFNLRCLCKLCHTYQDEHHAGYLKKGNAKATLNNFTQLYADVLRVKNPELFDRHAKLY